VATAQLQIGLSAGEAGRLSRKLRAFGPPPQRTAARGGRVDGPARMCEIDVSEY
jgi:hypothetical protein